VTAIYEVAVAEREADHNVVWLRGEYDISTVTTLTQTITETIVLDEASLVVDLSDVQFMDAATIGVIIGARNDLLLQTRSLAIRSPSRQARRVLDLCCLTEFFVDPSVLAPTIDLDCGER
jgi:anti-anti-sigma factor